jgi:glycine betaine/proline transport system ATP-binding protein
MSITDPVVEVAGVTKIFGSNPRGKPLAMMEAGVSKDDIFAQTGHVVGVSDVSFQVAKGEVFVIMGLSGSGKSTAIRLVNRLIEPTNGTVTVEGVDVTSLATGELKKTRREKMGMVFQHFALFPHRTVQDNVSYGLKVRKIPKSDRTRAAEQALSLVGLEGWGNNFPHELSGGMQQRVGLARALASDTPILLMDEAFSALDPLIRRQMQDELLDIQSRLHKTILFITHDLNEALRVGTTVCIMKDGAVVQVGTPIEILTDPQSAYVAEFMRDVDQGRVLDVQSVLRESTPLRQEDNVAMARARMEGRTELFVVDRKGVPVGIIRRQDVKRITSSSSVASVMVKDFPKCFADDRLSDIYELCQSGLPLAVTNDQHVLVGRVNALDVLGELGKIQALAEERSQVEPS